MFNGNEGYVGSNPGRWVWWYIQCTVSKYAASVVPVENEYMAYQVYGSLEYGNLWRVERWTMQTLVIELVSRLRDTWYSNRLLTFAYMYGRARSRGGSNAPMNRPFGTSVIRYTRRWNRLRHRIHKWIGYSNWEGCWLLRLIVIEYFTLTFRWITPNKCF